MLLPPLSRAWSIGLLASVLLASTTLLGQVKPPPRAADPKAAAAAAPTLKFEIGKEVQIEDPSLADGHFILYVPRDYTPDRAWPLIFCYHGINQSAKVWPFKELTDGKGFIVVGMSYVEKNGASTEKEIASLQRIGQLVAASLKVNPKMLFVGGFSRGGWMTYSIAAKDPSPFAGVIAFGMSGSPGGNNPAWQSKPILIAHGEKDEYCQKIETTLDAFQKAGAQVTHEVFKGQGHMVDTRNAVCKQWLLDNGPLKSIKADLELAKATEKSGKVGAALAMYEALARLTDGGEYSKSADAAAKSITDTAAKKLAEVEESVASKKYADAVKTLVNLEKTYAGSSVADKAKDRLAQIQNDPQIKATIEQAKIDAAADAMEAQAQGFEKSKDFGRALAIYEKYVAEHPRAARYAEVKAHFEALKADKTITAGIAGKQMETDCKSWLSMADNYIQAGLKDKARPFLQRIIDKYPASPHAATARQKLSEIR